MNPWKIYESRIASSGVSIRDAMLRRTRRLIGEKAEDGLFFQSVLIDGTEQSVTVISSDNLNEKTIISMPAETIRAGATVYWMENFWLVTEVDADITVHTKAKMVQCNYLLKWVDDDAQIHEQWCVIEDGTRYLTGQYEDRDFFVTRGDSRISMTIGKNTDTTRFRRGMRFLIDDADSQLMLAYELSKPYKLGGVYNGTGVFCFVLQEVSTTDYDAQELGIADYYRYFPKENSGAVSPGMTIDPDHNITDDGKRVWI